MSGVYELLTEGVVTSSHHDHPAQRRAATGVADFTSHGLVFKSSYKLADGRHDLSSTPIHAPRAGCPIALCQQACHEMSPFLGPHKMLKQTLRPTAG